MALKPFTGELDPATPVEPPVALKPFDGTLDGETPKRTIGGTIGDIGVTALKGAVALPQAAAGLASIATGGLAGKGLESIGVRFDDAQKFLDTQYSDAQQAAQKRVQDADGFVGTAKAMLQNPSTIATAAGESIPSMFAGGALARGLGLAARFGPAAAGAIGEGIMGAGSAAEQVRTQTADRELTAGQAGLAALSGVGTAAFGALGGKVAQRMGIGDVDTMIAQGAAKTAGQPAQRSTIAQMARGALSEGVLEELPQSLQEQALQNVALGKPWDEGLGKAAAQSLIVGGAMGAAGGGIGSIGNRRELAQEQAAIDRARAAAADSEAKTEQYLRDNPHAGWTAEQDTLTPEMVGPMPQGPQAPDISTAAGAGAPRDGVDFERQVDTSGLSLVDTARADREAAQAARHTTEFTAEDTTPEWSTAAGAAPVRAPGIDVPQEFDTGTLGFEQNLKPSHLMGIDPAAGPLSAAAATAVDSGASNGATADVRPESAGSNRSGSADAGAGMDAGLGSRDGALSLSQRAGTDRAPLGAVASDAGESAPNPSVARAPLARDGRLTVTPGEDGLLRNARGEPFTKAQARMAAKQNGGGLEPVEVDGGFALAKVEPSSATALAQSAQSAIDSEAPASTETAPKNEASSAELTSAVPANDAENQSVAGSPANVIAPAAGNQAPAPVASDAAAAQVVPAARPAGVEATGVAPNIEPTNSLARTASWVIREKATGAVVMETFDRKKVDALNTAKYEAVPVEQHLASINATALSEQPAGRPEQQGVAARAPGQRLGRDSVPIDEGGKPFKTRKAAGDAKKLQPMMRVVSVDGGYALAEKTPAQLAAEAKAARRLSVARAGTAGMPIAAHEFIATNGGLSRDVAADLGVEGNPRIGNRTLYAARGKGMSLDRATEALSQAGYIEDGDQGAALHIIRRSMTQPQYTAERWQQLAEAEDQARYQDHLDAQQDAAQAEDFDPFAPLGDYTQSDLAADPEYGSATDEQKAKVRALLERAESLGIDTEAIQEDVANQTASERAYYDRIENDLSVAISGRAGGDSARATDQDGRAGSGSAGQEGDRNSRPVDGEAGRAQSEEQLARDRDIAQAREDLADLETQHKKARGVVRKNLAQRIERLSAAIAEQEALLARGAPGDDVPFSRARRDAATPDMFGQQQSEPAPVTIQMGDGAQLYQSQDFRRLQAEVATLAAGQWRRMEIERQRFGRQEPTQYAALASMGNGETEVLWRTFPDSRQPLTDADLRALYDEKVAQRDKTAQRKDDAIKSRLDAIREKGITVGASWSDAETMTNTPAKPKGERIKVEATVKAISDDGMITVEGTRRGSGYRYQWTVAPDSRLFDNYPGFLSAHSESDLRQRAHEISGWNHHNTAPERAGVFLLDSGSYAKFDGLAWYRGESTPRAALKTEIPAAATRPKDRFPDQRWRRYADYSTDAFNEPKALRNIARDRGVATQATANGLTSYTPADLSARADAAAAAQREQARQQQAQDQRAQADAERGGFTLTGSDRPADVAEARGQQAMFSRSQAAADGVRLDRQSGDVLFSFAGQQAATADTMALATAQQRLDAGEDAEAVRQDTGWFKGADGKWRFEIDDSRAFLKGTGTFGDVVMARMAALEKVGERQSGDPVRLGDVLRHESLFAAYPALRGMEVQFTPRGTTASGRLAQDGGSTVIQVRQDLPGADALSVLLHEIQHGIQNIEGFATGGNQDSRADVMQAISQQRSLWADVYAVRRELDAGKKLDAVLEEWQEFLDAQPSAEALRIAQDPELETSVALQNMETLDRQYAQLRNEGRGDTYRRLAGEVEARNTQARQGMTDEQRRATPPSQTADVADSDVIVMFNGKDAAKAPAPANGMTLEKARRVIDSMTDGKPYLSPDLARRTAALQKAVEAIHSKWPNAPETVVVADMRDARIPRLVRDADAQQRSQGATGEPEGFFYAGKVYLVASQLHSPADAARVLAHESLGHYGLQGVFGDRFRPILNRVALARRAEVIAKAREYGLVGEGVNVKTASDAEVWQSMTLGQRQQASEEVLAVMAQTQPQSSFVRDAVAAIRSWLRENIPGFNNLRVTDDEIIREYILPARNWVERGRQSRVDGMPAFGRATNQPMATNNVAGQDQGGAPAGDNMGAPMTLFHGGKAVLSSLDGRGRKNRFLYTTPTEVMAKEYGQHVTRLVPDKDARIADLSAPEALYGSQTAVEAIQQYAQENDIDPDDLVAAVADGRAWETYGEYMQDDINDVVGAALGVDIVALPDSTFASNPQVQGKTFVVLDKSKVKITNEPSASGGSGAMFSRAATAQPGQRTQTAPSQPGAKWAMPEPSRFDSAVYKMQDKHVDTLRVIQEIEKAGKAIAEDQNIRLQEELYHGRSAKRVNDFAENELKPVLEYMRGAGLTMADVEEYLHARHAREANAVIAAREPSMPDGGSGMTNAAADAYMKALPADQRAKLEKAAEGVDAIIAGTRDLYVAYGLESQSVTDGWKRQFKHYVPLMREDKDGGMGIGQGFSIKGKEVKGRTGSTRKVVDIFSNIAMQRERVIVRGEKNRVAQAAVKLAEANPNTDFWTVDKVPTTRVHDPKTNTVVDQPDTMFKQRENVLVAKFVQPDGSVIERAVVFDPDNERAVRMAGALKNLDAQQLEGMLAASAKVTRYFAAVNTQWNPVFGVVNIVRDVQGALVNLQSTPLAGQQATIAKHTASALMGIYADLRAARGGKKGNSQWAQLFEQFQQDGGQTGYRDQFATSADRAEAMERVLNPEAWAKSGLGRVISAGGTLTAPMEQVRKTLAPVFNWLTDYNDSMENAVRLAAYKTALDRGISRQQAASIAKNLTVNFNRKGQVATQAGALYAFFNAAMQGSARIGQALFTMDGGDVKTIRLSKTGKQVVLGGILLGTLQALALAAAGFDDEDPPEFVRERSLIIPTGGKSYVTIPMPLGLHVIPGLGRQAMEFALSGGKDPAKRLISVAGMFADAFNPIGNAGLSMQTLAPTVLDPLAALTENKDFTGKDIARKSMNKAMPGHMQGKDTSTWLGKMIAEGINYLSGGNQYRAGVFSPTPDQIDYLAAQVGGGVWRELSKVEQTATTAASGEELAPYKVPLLGRFYGNAKSQASQATAFYAGVDRLNALETEIKNMRKDGRWMEAGQLMRSRPDAPLIDVANTAERRVQELRRQKRELVRQGAEREVVRAKEEQITQVMQRFNETAARLTS